jgi:D-beta-D-heptose 7-phosphate kinase/D-beta-D-heptose 1-phosphate adenosyltransferase
MPKVIFTNGVFDLLHPGHIFLLRAAKELGGKLIVGINSDESAKQLGKRPKRPIQKQEARKVILEANRYVDKVIIFDEVSPMKLIEKLKPDIIVKGGDYRKKDVVGKRFVESLGGKVVIVPFEEGYGTSKLIHSIRKL